MVLLNMKTVPLRLSHRQYTYAYLCIFSSFMLITFRCLNSFHLLVQMAKDITEFLAWAAEPEMEERKLVSKD